MSTMACVEIKVQVVLQFEVCRGLGEVLLSPYGLSEIVAEFGPKPGPRLSLSEKRGTRRVDAIDAKTT